MLGKRIVPGRTLAFVSVLLASILGGCEVESTSPARVDGFEQVRARRDEWEFNPENVSVAPMCAPNSPACSYRSVSLEENGDWTVVAETRWMDGTSAWVSLYGTAYINTNWGGYLPFGTLLCSSYSSLCSDFDSTEGTCGFETNVVRLNVTHRARKWVTPYEDVGETTEKCIVNGYGGGGGGPGCGEGMGYWQQYFYYIDGEVVAEWWELECEYET